MSSHPEKPALVVVGGAPATGKTTLAHALRAHLRLPLIAKDDLKEALGEALHVHGPEDSRRLGAATFTVQFAVLRELLAARVSVIAEGNFGAKWFEGLPAARIVQVHLTAPPEVLRARMLDRAGTRHAVHYDREAADDVTRRAEAGEWTPLPLGGRLIVVETEPWPDVDGIVAEAEAAVFGPP